MEVVEVVSAEVVTVVVSVVVTVVVSVEVTVVVSVEDAAASVAVAEVDSTPDLPHPSSRSLTSHTRAKTPSSPTSTRTRFPFWPEWSTTSRSNLSARSRMCSAT